MKKQLKLLRLKLAGLSAAVAALVAGCNSTPSPQPAGTPAPSPSPSTTTPSAPRPAPAAPPKISTATTPRDYRRDAARHLYERNAERIFQGKLQPNLYAIGVLEVHLDRNGMVSGLHWMRAPRHAPEVITEIERTVRAAAPYPPPSRMGKVTYTDTWLWDKSGQFQLDTLTEGQL
jgi:protein TonB